MVGGNQTREDSSQNTGEKCGIPRESKDKTILDADYKNRRVFFGRRVAGEVGGNGEFNVKVENITMEAQRLGKTITGDEVAEEFKTLMAE